MKVSDWPSRSNGDGHKNKIVFYELFRLSFMNYSGYLGSNQFYVKKALSEPEIITLLKNKY